MTPERIKEIKARCEAATGDEWGWFDMGHGPILATRRHGRLIVMDFVRKGMQSAQPRFAKRERYAGGIMYDADNIDIDAHPDCQFIAHARQDLPDCLDEIERREQELSLEKANAEMRRKEISLGTNEIVRLKGLVKRAYREGAALSRPDQPACIFDEDNRYWDHSNARKALEQ